MPPKRRVARVPVSTKPQSPDESSSSSSEEEEEEMPVDPKPVEEKKRGRSPKRSATTSRRRRGASPKVANGERKKKKDKPAKQREDDDDSNPIQDVKSGTYELVGWLAGGIVALICVYALTLQDVPPDAIADSVVAAVKNLSQ